MGSSLTAKSIVENYSNDDSKRMCLFFTKIQSCEVDSLDSSSSSLKQKAIWKDKGWIETDEVKIREMEAKRKQKLEATRETREAERWLKKTPLFNSKERRGNIPGYSQKKCSLLQAAGIRDVEAFAEITDYCALKYIGSKDKTNVGGRLRADIAFEKKVEEVREIVSSSKGLSNWHEYLEKREHYESVLTEEKSTMSKDLSDTQKEENRSQEEQGNNKIPQSEDVLEDLPKKTIRYRHLSFTFSNKTVDNVSTRIFLKLEGFLKQLISSTEPTSFLKIDETFRVMKYCKVKHPLSSKEWINPFKCLVTLKNAFGQYLGAHANFGGGNFEEIKPYLELLLKRCREFYANPNWTFKAIFVDR